MEPIPRLLHERALRIRGLAVLLVVASAFSITPAIAAEKDSAIGWATLLANHYALHSNIVYGHGNNIPLNLDVWERQKATEPVPTVIYIHGGGWMIGAKEGAQTLLMPYLARGWNAVNVEYRLGEQSLAPAAVEDTRCALRWVFRNASKYHFDTNRLVVTGHSAGGHLALITGLLTEEAGLDNGCPADPKMGDVPLHVAAIVNWYGITDVADLLSGPNRKTYAVAWLGGQPNREAIAKRVSPLDYVRAGVPPIITVHGDQDPTVPYAHAVRLDEALAKASVPHELVTIKGGVHGSFNDAQTEDAYKRIWTFLSAHVAGLPK